ncbi:MAG: hypothetical protein DMG97_02440 [Acidobacteria bacterium]|nr:MAG: hypothetical protein DMG97_02440 [Acidobacteriota bacterium]PYV78879.1 MAG: hypothetical protein DMG96_06335 [Acidobacteriota bacterium]
MLPVSWSVPLESTRSSLIETAERLGGPASDALFSALYSELHRLAKRQLARQGFGVNVSATTLLHEAYIEMAGKDGAAFPDRARFMGYAARVMRGLIIDHARSRSAQKRAVSSRSLPLELKLKIQQTSAS